MALQSHQIAHVKLHRTTYGEKWEIKLSDSHMTRVNIVPWDHFIVISLITAIDEAIEHKMADLRPRELDLEVPHMIGQTFAMQQYHFFDVSTKQANFIGRHQYMVKIFLALIHIPMNIQKDSALLWPTSLIPHPLLFQMECSFIKSGSAIIPHCGISAGASGNAPVLLGNTRTPR